MTDPQQDRPVDLARNLPPPPAGPITATEIIAAILSLLWLAVVTSYYLLGSGGDGAERPGTLLTLFVVFLPIALIWVTAVTGRMIGGLRDEAARLKVAVDALRQSYVVQQQQAAARKPDAVERKLDELAATARQTETAVASFASRRDGPAVRVVTAPPPAAAPPADDQPALALGTPADALQPMLSVQDFILALNFPDSPDDKDGFRALRLALEDRDVSKLVRAAQDVLTLLSQDGIYMDDLRPDRARPEVWRQFAQGERGRGIAALGGIRDRSSLALTAGRMRADPVFRDSAHHFLRQFDRSFSKFEKTASDADIATLSDTRTARVFMLFGRVTGIFD